MSDELTQPEPNEDGEGVKTPLDRIAEVANKVVAAMETDKGPDEFIGNVRIFSYIHNEGRLITEFGSIEVARLIISGVISYRIVYNKIKDPNKSLTPTEYEINMMFGRDKQLRDIRFRKRENDTEIETTLDTITPEKADEIIGIIERVGILRGEFVKEYNQREV